MLIEESWNEICIRSVRKERVTVENKYGIKIGQTGTYCVRCKQPCWPNDHVCWDIQLEHRRETSKTEAEENAFLIEKIRSLGRSKASTMLKIPKGALSHWIDRRKIPEKYRAEIRGL